MIILKQCLDHNIVPMIIRDIHKAEYNRYLNKAQHEQDYKGLEAYFEKEQKYYQESIIPMIFDFDELQNKGVINREWTRNEVGVYG